MMFTLLMGLSGFYFRFVLVSALRKKSAETKLVKDQKNTCETHTE